MQKRSRGAKLLAAETGAARLIAVLPVKQSQNTGGGASAGKREQAVSRCFPTGPDADTAENALIPVVYHPPGARLRPARGSGAAKVGLPDRQFISAPEESAVRVSPTAAGHAAPRLLLGRSNNGPVAARLSIGRELRSVEGSRRNAPA